MDGREPRVGFLDCGAAVFIYKNDGSEESIWKDVSGRFDEEKAKVPFRNTYDPFHAEWHTTKESFLNGLQSWHAHGDTRNTLLCLNSHAGPRGINCVGTSALEGKRDKSRITWSELASCLSAGVDYLWLLGCETKTATDAWQAEQVPVQRMLLVTTSTGYYPSLINCLVRFEIGMEVTYVIEMPNVIRDCAPDLAPKTKYLLRDGRNWRELRPSE